VLLIVYGDTIEHLLMSTATSSLDPFVLRGRSTTDAPTAFVTKGKIKVVRTTSVAVKQKPLSRGPHGRAGSSGVERK
jgi:hypothetical protein